MIKPSVKYAILCALFLVGLFFISIRFGSNPLFDFRHLFFDLGIFFLFIFFAGKEFKDYRNGGVLHFWQGISIGFIVFIPAVLFSSIIFYVIFEQFPILIEQYRQGANEMLESKRSFYLEEFGEEGIADMKQKIANRTPFDLVLRMARNKFFLAFLVSPVVAIFLRKKQ